MKKFFNSYRIIFLIGMISFISNGVLHYYEILTIKEYYAIFGGIFLLSVISYLINYISDISKINNIVIQHNITLNKSIVDNILINNYLTNMCSISYEYIDNDDL